MDDWVTIVLIIVAVAAAFGVGGILGADIGYRRGWLFGEASAQKRSLRQIKFAEEQVAKVLAREARTIERVYGNAE